MDLFSKLLEFPRFSKFFFVLLKQVVIDHARYGGQKCVHVKNEVMCSVLVTQNKLSYIAHESLLHSVFRTSYSTSVIFAEFSQPSDRMRGKYSVPYCTLLYLCTIRFTRRSCS